MLNQARQGDVFLLKVPTLPKSAKTIQKHTITLALGEVTGHAHTIVAEKAELLSVDGATADTVDRWLRTGSGTVAVKHQEHGAIVLDPNTVYAIRRQREYAPGEIRRVAD